jgi:hypothetical protein
MPNEGVTSFTLKVEQAGQFAAAIGALKLLHLDWAKGVGLEFILKAIERHNENSTREFGYSDRAFCLTDIRRIANTC